MTVPSKMTTLALVRRAGRWRALCSRRWRSRSCFLTTYGRAQGGCSRLIEGLLLVALVAGDPGQDQPPFAGSCGHSPSSSSLSSSSSSLWATVLLIDDLIHGGTETNSASDLLQAGAIVWVSNNIAFALLYWELDGGGAAARAHNPVGHADFGFPQQLNPRIARPSWRPRFIDYLYLGFTNATAFSPTDVMPLAPWAKIAMTVSRSSRSPSLS